MHQCIMTPIAVRRRPYSCAPVWLSGEQSTVPIALNAEATRRILFAFYAETGPVRVSDQQHVILLQVMQKICRESEASLDYYSLFKAIMKRVPVPMSPLESLASSAVRTAHKVILLQHAGHAASISE